MNTKICSKCKIEKDVSCFYKDKTGKYRVGCWCKKCTKRYQKQFRKDNVLKIAEYRKSNILKIANYRKNGKLQKKEWRKHYNKDVAIFNSYSKKLEIFEKIRRYPENLELLEVKCAYCGKWVLPTNLQVGARLQFFNGTSSSEHRFYCSEACKISCPSYGQKLYWKGQKEERLGTSREVSAWFRQFVLETDNWTCQKCLKSKEEFSELVLHVHHIKGVAQKPMLQNDIDNAITLCIDCHKEIHKTKGCTYFDLRRLGCKTN